VLLLVLAALFLSAPALAQSGQDAISARQRELRDLKKQIEENRKKILDLERKEKKLGDLNGRLRRDRDLTSRYLAELEQQEQAVALDIAERQQELGAKTDEQEKAKARLRMRLRLYQRSRRPHTAELLLSSKSFPELFARGTILARAIQRDRTDLLWLSQQREELSLAASELEARHRDINTLQEEKEREREKLESRSRKTRAELTSLQKERSVFEARQKELVKAEKQIGSLIARLEAERKKAPKEKGKSKIQGKGQLPWPVKGELVGRFGLDKHPRFGTQVPNKGIDIAAPAGTSVTAVAAGSVAFADWLPGYGRCVILNHSGGLYTLYAHCARLLVSQGASVSAGGKIAEVGDTDSVKGTCLHFEVRQGEEAMDPLRWLR
jgi:septal ring factor EnvC (AmiA/AmiB activator)